MDNEYERQIDTEKPGHGALALASLIMGIMGLVTVCCCYGGFIFGGLGVIFALLSKAGDKLEGYGLGGMITSVVAIILAFLVFLLYFAAGIFDEILQGGMMY